MSLPTVPLPERLESALELRQQLEQEKIYFAPVRHHSPACAYAVLSLIEQIQPDYVLIEGPESFNPLIKDLLDVQTRPPVAIMAQVERQQATSSESESDSVTRSAYFPFCEYSPEWQALHVGNQHKAKLQFIDLPWFEQVSIDEKPDHQNQSLQKERYLAHSLFIAQLAKRCGCRDHDELWEHLFELRHFNELKDWRGVFHDSFIWCALARLDYEEDVLLAEGSIQRELHMQGHIQTIKLQHPAAKIVVVTGGFHTLALIEGVAATIKRSFQLTATQQQQFQKQQKSQRNDSAWLIRYSYDRLDALNGYASGMPSPAFYQRVWESIVQQQQSQTDEPTVGYRHQLAIAYLSLVAQVLRDKQFDAAPGFLSVKLAAEQSFRLAAFRGHVGPGRYDLLDGLQSVFIKGSLDESQNLLWDEIKTCFSGFALGQVPKNTLTPPLVSETYQIAKGFHFKLEDTLAKVSRLDVYRNKQHRIRSRFLHLLAFLDIHFAKHIAGPNFLSGNQMDLLFEEWQYAWTPNVEGELISLSEKGTQLKSIALNRLIEMERNLEVQGLSRSSQSAVTLLMQAALIGLQQRMPILLNLLDRYIQQDTQFESLVACGHKLVHLWRGRQFFDIEDKSTISVRLDKLLQQLFYCFSYIAQGDEQQQEQNFNGLLSCRELITFMPEINQQVDYSEHFYHQLDRLDGKLNHAPLLKGAVDALRYLGNRIDESRLVDEIERTFSAGSDPEMAIGYFMGVMRTTPELIIRLPILVGQLNALLEQWDEARFLQILPDMRFAFSQLTPKQNAQMAHYIAQQLEMETQELTLHQTEFSEKQMLQAVQLEHKLQAKLKDLGLANWFAIDSGSQNHE